MSRLSQFEKRSILVAEGFLQTALILDDQAYPEGEPEIPASSLNPPQPYAGDEFNGEGEEPAVISAVTYRNNPVPTKEIVRAFADLGIVCAVMDPSEEAGTLPLLQPDITIIDWYIRDETGKRAQQLLTSLIEAEQVQRPHQIRFVFVYTTEPDLLAIREKLSKMLTSLEVTTPSEFGQTGLSWEGWHFIVLAKPGTPVANNLSSLVVEYEDLPKRVVREFARLAGGLLPNVAMAGLTAIRQNTHRILKRFSSALDAAYLTHRSLLPTPADSEDHLVSLLSSELAGVLEDQGVAESSCATAAREWIGGRDLKFPLKIESDGQEFELQDRRRLGDLFSKGVYNNPQLKKLDDESVRELLIKKIRSKLTSLLGGKSKPDDVAFAELTIVRPHYGSVMPRLALGTVVSAGGGKAYWLCIQPKCDSVRLTEPRPFLFIPLEKNGRFDICMLRGDKKPLKLLRGRKPYMLKTYTFKPDKSGVIKAHEHDGGFCFVSSGAVKLRFEGQLRDEIAQSIAHRVATSLSRVGVDRSEWQRLSLPRYLRDQ